MLHALAEPAALAYEPNAFGSWQAREAVARSYAELGHSVRPERICLTASTSEAYALLFKLLADPGDEVLIPEPGYPLFTYLATLEGVTVRGYPLAYDGAWHLDISAVRERVTPRTKAIVLVSPNNPTGSYTKRDELDALLSLGIPLISDEVFARYAFSQDSSRVTSVASETRGLSFSLGGLSKQCGFPQIKVGWMVAAGEDSLVKEALERLEIIADTFLSVATPPQLALGSLLAHGKTIEQAIVARTAHNLALLRAQHTKDDAWSILNVEGGWYATLRVPTLLSEESWVLRLLERGVFVQPGHYFDFPNEAFLTVSLLTPEDVFKAGLTILLETLRTTIRNS